MRKLLFLHAAWCAPCRFAEKHIITEIEAACHEQVERVDVDAMPSYAHRMGVKALPTSILLEDDKVIEKYVGKNIPKDEIIQWLKGDKNDSDNSDR